MLLINDFTTSVRKALDEIDPKWESYPGLIICGTHTPENLEENILRIQDYRERKLPVLGICAGLQLMAIEYARNVLHVLNATSEEFADSGTFVVKKLPTIRVGLINGESYWHNYEVEDWLLKKLWSDVFSPRYFGVQYHPEYQSSKDTPHPLLVNFIEECKR